VLFRVGIVPSASGWTFCLSGALTSTEGGGKLVPFQGPPNCSLCWPDLDGDGRICQRDLGMMLSAFGLCDGDRGYLHAANVSAATTCPNEPTKQVIDQSDLGVLLAEYGCGGCP
jgi:hypothetical protein